jgi:hypothetical protein
MRSLIASVYLVAISLFASTTLAQTGAVVVGKGPGVKVTPDVVAVDPSTQTVTLKGPKQTVDLKVRDPAQFKLINVGDQVEADYSEALAIAVEPAAKK